MRRLSLIILFSVVVIANAAGQSGRHLTNPPPPPPPPPPQESLSSEATTTSLSPSIGGALPGELMGRQLKTIDSTSFHLADFKGKVIVVNLWATWCGPCRREVPDYEKVRKEFAGREVEFIALTTEDPVTAASKVQKFVREFNFGFLIGWADRDTARILMNGRGAIPQTLVIGSDGTIANRWTGYSPSQSQERLRGAIERALADRKAEKSMDTK